MTGNTIPVRWRPVSLGLRNKRAPDCGLCSPRDWDRGNSRLFSLFRLDPISEKPDNRIALSFYFNPATPRYPPPPLHTPNYFTCLFRRS